MSEVGQKLIAEVRKIAAEQPDYVYEHDKCLYMIGDGPGCIMGKALFNLGYLPSDRGVEDMNIDLVLDRLDLRLDQDEIRWCSKVQAAQDGQTVLESQAHTFAMSQPERRLSWGNAVRYADGDLT